MADPYDDDTKSQGLGTPSGPDFAAPKTYNADPETAAAETGNQGSSSETDSTTAEEAINLLYTTPVWNKEIRKFAAI